MPDLPAPASQEEETRDNLHRRPAKRRDKRMKGQHERYRDLPARESRLTEEAIERGAPHLDLENPAIWKGNILADEDD